MHMVGEALHTLKTMALLTPPTPTPLLTPRPTLPLARTLTASLLLLLRFAVISAAYSSGSQSAKRFRDSLNPVSALPPLAAFQAATRRWLEARTAMRCSCWPAAAACAALARGEPTRPGGRGQNAM
jgi:hypothetical protein